MNGLPVLAQIHAPRSSLDATAERAWCANDRRRRASWSMVSSKVVLLAAVLAWRGDRRPRPGASALMAAAGYDWLRARDPRRSDRVGASRLKSRSMPCSQRHRHRGRRRPLCRPSWRPSMPERGTCSAIACSYSGRVTLVLRIGDGRRPVPPPTSRTASAIPTLGGGAVDLSTASAPRLCTARTRWGRPACASAATGSSTTCARGDA